MDWFLWPVPVGSERRPVRGTVSIPSLILFIFLGGLAAFPQYQRGAEVTVGDRRFARTTGILGGPDRALGGGLTGRLLHRNVPPMPHDLRAPIPAPFLSTSLKVIPEWIDYNGHMNVAYYLKAFDEGFDATYAAMEFGFDMIERRGISTMAAEMHITYQGELFQGDPIRIETQLVDFNRKRFHWFQQMRHGETLKLAATCEWMILFIDMNKRKVAEMPDDIFDLMSRVKAAHAHLPRPPEVGRSISLENRRRG
jgi:acyl-CoA thioester hydrolase